MTKPGPKPMNQLDRETVRYQMLTANECVAALDQALFMAKQYTTVESAIAAFRSVRQEYSRKRDQMMERLSTLGHHHAD